MPAGCTPNELCGHRVTCGDSRPHSQVERGHEQPAKLPRVHSSDLRHDQCLTDAAEPPGANLTDTKGMGLRCRQEGAPRRPKQRPSPPNQPCFGHELTATMEGVGPQNFGLIWAQRQRLAITERLALIGAAATSTLVRDAQMYPRRSGSKVVDAVLTEGTQVCRCRVAWPSGARHEGGASPVRGWN